MLHRQFMALLEQSQSYRVLPSAQAQRMLKAGNFIPTAHASLLTAALSAGQILGVKSVFFGYVMKEGGEYKLDIFLVDTISRKIATSVRIRYTGNFDMFVANAPEAALKHFLAASENVARGTESVVSVPLSVSSVNDRASLRDLPTAARPLSEPPGGKPRPPLTTAGEINPPTYSESYSEFGGGRLAIGTRMMFFNLQEKRKDTFFGSIDYLKAQQDYLPSRLFANWMFDDKHGIECTWDEIAAQTLTTEDGHSDGTIRVHGLIFSLFRRQPMILHLPSGDRKIEPYIGAGLALYKARFDHEPWYYNGFNGDTWQDAVEYYNAWVEAGSRPWPNGGYRRIFTLSDPFGLVLNAGCSLKLNEYLSADIHFRYTKADVDGFFVLGSYEDLGPPRNFTFPMSHTAMGFGLKYSF